MPLKPNHIWAGKRWTLQKVGTEQTWQMNWVTLGFYSVCKEEVEDRKRVTGLFRRLAVTDDIAERR